MAATSIAERNIHEENYGVAINRKPVYYEMSLI